MGKTEKLVLLSVVLVLVVLFVWSLGGDGADAAEREAPRYGTGAGMLQRPDEPLLYSELKGDAEEDAPPGSDEDGAGAGDSGEDGDLGIDVEGPAGEGPVHEGGDDAAVDDVPGDAPARPVRMMPGWDLVTTAGLEATVDPEMLLHRPADGATWESLARDLYGKASFADLLRHNNEGMETPGEVVFVPAKNELGPEGNVRYVQVLKGETLWAVAQRTLGSGSRWKEIYEANRDVVPDPDFLAPGTVLTIPE